MIKSEIDHTATYEANAALYQVAPRKIIKISLWVAALLMGLFLVISSIATTTKVQAYCKWPCFEKPYQKKVVKKRYRKRYTKRYRKHTRRLTKKRRSYRKVYAKKRVKKRVKKRTRKRTKYAKKSRRVRVSKRTTKRTFKRSKSQTAVTDMYVPPRNFGVDYKVVRALIRQESGGNCCIRSHAGALGKFQIMPGTARVWAARAGHPRLRRASYRNLKRALYTPSIAQDIARVYMNFYARKYAWAGRAQIPLVLIAYNGGPKRAQQAARCWKRHGYLCTYRRETHHYVRNIMKMAGLKNVKVIRIGGKKRRRKRRR